MTPEQIKSLLYDVDTLAALVAFGCCELAAVIAFLWAILDQLWAILDQLRKK